MHVCISASNIKLPSLLCVTSVPSAGLLSMLPPLSSNVVGDDLSDDEDSHRHKNIPGGSKLSMEAKYVMLTTITVSLFVPFTS